MLGSSAGLGHQEWSRSLDGLALAAHLDLGRSDSSPETVEPHTVPWVRSYQLGHLQEQCALLQSIPPRLPSYPYPVSRFTLSSPTLLTTFLTSLLLALSYVSFFAFACLSFRYSLASFPHLDFALPLGFSFPSLLLFSSSLLCLTFLDSFPLHLLLIPSNPSRPSYASRKPQALQPKNADLAHSRRMARTASKGRSANF